MLRVRIGLSVQRLPRTSRYFSTADVESQLASVKAASEAFAKYDQKTVDHIFVRIAHEANKQRLPLAKLAHEETKMGLMEDKVLKNGLACELILDRFRDLKTCGIVDRDEIRGVEHIATPMGVVCCIAPTTNPTSTAIAKSLFCAKTRNAAIFLPHPRAARCTAEAVKICHDAGVAAGAPEGFLQCIQPHDVSRECSHLVMTHDNVNVILATGGPGMVKASYSVGKPAIGVGSGNAPILVDETADLEMACGSIVLGKTFDNGMICAAEQSVVAVDAIYDKFKAMLEARGVCFLEGKDKQKLGNYLIQNGRVNPDIVGQSAQTIADRIGVKVPRNTVVLAGEASEIGPSEPLSHEKLSPVLGLYRTRDFADGMAIAKELTEFDGIGHTAGIYSKMPERVNQFALAVPAGRILHNMPTSLGAIGTAFNFNVDPSFTLGVGTKAGSSVSTNVGPLNLVNIKTVATRQEHTEWFQNPPKIYFNRNCLEDALRDASNVYANGSRDKRCLIITDHTMVGLGQATRVGDILKAQGFSVEVFDEVKPDPDMKTVHAGVKACESFKPDMIVCLGGGSPMDAGKFIRVVYEHPELHVEDAASRFIEIRKRTSPFPKLGSKVHRLVCIPTSSGTASEVTPFAVITDDDGMKHPVFSYQLTPDIAIIDSSFCDKLPKSLVANAGVDAITHATEAFVSVAANEFTESHAIKAIQLLFDNLPMSYQKGDIKARENVHHAASLAGLAFSNSFLGITHSLSHKVGAAFHLPHGLTNAILMPHVIRYNASDSPMRMGIYPGYDHPVAKSRYAQIARSIGCSGSDGDELVEAYCQRIMDLMSELDMPMTFQEAGISEENFLRELDNIAIAAFDDQCTPANPRFPLTSELKLILLDAYYGRQVCSVNLNEEQATKLSVSA
mmetsp:Transcript_21414/g.33813  ORF Transcript_21414/g.33813 Transcript_21414/m.33813 type:complete len:901 (-) Transcript_21414:166-2868(-)